MKSSFKVVRSSDVPEDIHQWEAMHLDDEDMVVSETDDLDEDDALALDENSITEQESLSKAGQGFAGFNGIPRFTKNNRKLIRLAEDQDSYIQKWQVEDLPPPVVEKSLSDEDDKEVALRTKTTAADLLAQMNDEKEAVLSRAEGEADQIIQEARQQAEEILRQAQAEGEAIKAKAYTDAVTAARSEVMNAQQGALAVIHEAQAWWERTMRLSEPAIIETIQAVTQKLFGKGAVLNADILKDVIGQALSEASQLGNLRIYMNPEDVQAMVSLWQDSEMVLNGQRIQLVSSQNILRGGCFIEGEYGSVDSRLDVQLNMLNEALAATLVTKQKEDEE